MADRLDGQRIETLRVWGVGLAADTRAELRAAGKAIVMLVEEIDRLQVDVREASDAGRPRAEPVSDPDEPIEPLEPLSSQSLGASLRERLGAVIPGNPTYERKEG